MDSALFYTGDPHFAQDDGEVALTALESSLRATVRLTVIKNSTDGIPGDNNGFDMAFGETEDYWIPIGLNEDLDEAMKMSVRESIDFLSEEFSLDRALVYAYLSVGTDYEESYYVDAEPVLAALGADVTKDDNTYIVKYEDISYKLNVNTNIYDTKV